MRPDSPVIERTQKPAERIAGAKALLHVETGLPQPQALPRQTSGRRTAAVPCAQAGVRRTRRWPVSKAGTAARLPDGRVTHRAVAELAIKLHASETGSLVAKTFLVQRPNPRDPGCLLPQPHLEPSPSGVARLRD